MRPRFSSLLATGIAVAGVLLLVAALLLGRTSESGKTVVTVRLWDEQVAAAYRQSFAEFNRTHPDIEVHVNVVAYANYFTTLRTEIAGGGADDIVWMSNAYVAEYADNDRLLPVAPSTDWDPSTVEQFTRNGTLWAVPQLTDAGIALYFNADLLAAAGVGPAELAARSAGHLAAAPGPAHRRRKREPGRRTGFRSAADQAVGLQRRQRYAGHLPQLHRIGRRHLRRR
jgi:multiple sugar transport system substrate-binding protein